MFKFPPNSGPEVVLRVFTYAVSSNFHGNPGGRCGVPTLEGEMRLREVVSLPCGHTADEKPSKDSDLTCLDHGPGLMACGRSIRDVDKTVEKIMKDRLKGSNPTKDSALGFRELRTELRGHPSQPVPHMEEGPATLRPRPRPATEEALPTQEARRGEGGQLTEKFTPGWVRPPWEADICLP